MNPILFRIKRGYHIKRSIAADYNVSISQYFRISPVFYV